MTNTLETALALLRSKSTDGNLHIRADATDVADMLETFIEKEREVESQTAAWMNAVEVEQTNLASVPRDGVSVYAVATILLNMTPHGSTLFSNGSSLVEFAQWRVAVSVMMFHGVRWAAQPTRERMANVVGATPTAMLKQVQRSHLYMPVVRELHTKAVQAKRFPVREWKEVVDALSNQ